jgi:hypothetical protein
MKPVSKNRVLNVVYLPEPLDLALREEAANSNMAISDLLLHYLKIGVDFTANTPKQKKEKSK